MKVRILLASILFCLFLNSCSRQSLVRMTVKTPKIDYKKIDGFKSLSDFHKDAIYAVALIKETYPRLYDKIPDFDEQSTKFIQNHHK